MGISDLNLDKSIEYWRKSPTYIYTNACDKKTFEKQDHNQLERVRIASIGHGNRK